MLELRANGAIEVKQVGAYSGKGKYANKTESLKNLGPIPRGYYVVEKIFATHKDRVDAGYTKKLGDQVIHLKPDASTNVYGRGDFRVHGDNSKGDRSASNGCIIAAPGIRRKFELGDRILVTD
ncbi:hypothetical protein CTAYLR_001362 [Chrysophaeum taylorii]|uniref:Tlde1 domain-containing protein n=1 Tax=Chrysophaeum taylorii TaxID=2483200 RepID=A0AAD7XER2_9STRA|nr:hypothetical protein CTAYLR_001362 [Chrysophaeum taylorii]